MASSCLRKAGPSRCSLIVRLRFSFGSELTAVFSSILPLSSRGRLAQQRGQLDGSRDLHHWGGDKVMEEEGREGQGLEAEPPI